MHHRLENPMKYKYLLITLFSGAILTNAQASTTTPEIPIATINVRKILSDSKVAKDALAKFQTEYLPKDKELQGLAATLKEKSADLEKIGPSLSPSQVKDKQSEIDALARDLKRRQQQFVEDRDARKRDDIQRVLGIATQAVKKVAEVSHIDIVFQDVVYANSKTDITSKVIDVMDSEAVK